MSQCVKINNSKMHEKTKQINEATKEYDYLIESDFSEKFAKALGKLDRALYNEGFSKEYRMKIVSRLAVEFKLT